MDKAVDQAIDESVEPAPEEEDPSLVAQEWCDSEHGDRIAQLDSAVLETENLARVKRIQDTMLKVASDAPPGADCASSGIDTLIVHWNTYAADRATQGYEPRGQVRKLRAFVRDHRLKETFE